MTAPTNHLSHLPEFQRLLANYTMSPVSHKVLDQTRLVLLLAPSSTGRNTIIRELVKSGNYHYVVSDTTREPRVNDGVPEENGREYWFKTEEEMLSDLRSGKFIEAEIIHNQQVSGPSVRELELAKTSNKIAITDIDLKGMINLKKAKPDTVGIVVLPPDFEEWQRRITKRGTMEPHEYKNRLDTAYRIFDYVLAERQIYFVINDIVAEAAASIDTLANGQISPNHSQDQQVARSLVQELLTQTTKLLRNLQTNSGF